MFVRITFGRFKDFRLRFSGRLELNKFGLLVFCGGWTFLQACAADLSFIILKFQQDRVFKFSSTKNLDYSSKKCSDLNI